jgi:hypothetical protein
VRSRVALPILSALAAPLALAALLLAGCSPKSGMVPNLEPETTLFVQGDLDTVNHVVQLFWFGSDADGEIDGFELRFHNPDAPTDTAWRFTTRTDSLFTVFAPTGNVSPLFEVRAIDNQGARDATPAREDFTFRNFPPAVLITSGPGTTDTTFASATFTWQPFDPDGDLNRIQYFVWINSDSTNPRLVNGTSYTVPSDDFRNDSGNFESKPCTLHVRPVDDGGRAGNPTTRTWYVRAPVTGPRARLLIIDDVPTTNTANFATDTLYQNTAARNLPAGSWSVLRLQSTQPFRSALDVQQTCALFEAVIWYRGSQTNFSTVLRDYQDGIAGYLDAGGRFMIEGLNLTEGYGTTGPIRESFVRDHLATDFLHRNYNSTTQDSSVAWGIGNGAVLRSTVYADSLRLGAIFDGLRAFAVQDTDDVALWARSGTLTQSTPLDVAVGVSAPQPSGGRAIMLTVPLVAANAPFPGGGPRTAARCLAKIYAQLGLTGP